MVSSNPSSSSIDISHEFLNRWSVAVTRIVVCAHIWVGAASEVGKDHPMFECISMNVISMHGSRFLRTLGCLRTYPDPTQRRHRAFRSCARRLHGACEVRRDRGVERFFVKISQRTHGILAEARVRVSNAGPGRVDDLITIRKSGRLQHASRHLFFVDLLLDLRSGRCDATHDGVEKKRLQTFAHGHAVDTCPVFLGE